MVKLLSAKKPPKRLIFRWSTLKGSVAILLFLSIALLIQYCVVVYAMSLGVQDKQLLHGSFRFPATNLTITISVSPLFHLVPIATVITLVSSWSYLTKYMTGKSYKESSKPSRPPAQRSEKRRLRVINKLSLKTRGFLDRLERGLLRIRGIEYLWHRTRFARATIESSLTVLLVFGTFIVLISVLAYPKLIYQAISNAYQNNPSLVDSMKAIGNVGKGFAESLPPIGLISSTVSRALLHNAPGFRAFTLGLGGSIRPLAELDANGKYLVFQNMASWISALTALFYGEYRRRSHQYRRRY